MEKITITCPFTGVPFTALKTTDGSLLAQNPITKETMRIGYNKPSKRYLLNECYFRSNETVSCTEAAQILGVSRARISAIIRDDVIPSFIVNKKTVFKREDIIRYSESRTVGRPPKEG